VRCEDARAVMAGERYAEPSAELQAHLAGCAECRAVHARHAALDRVLALDESAPVSADFDARFFARLEQEKRRKPAAPRRLRRWLFIAAPVLAAAAAIALLLRPHEEPRAELPPDDVALAMDLELVEDIDVVQRLDELEAYEVLGQLDEAELERLAEPEPEPR